MLTYLGSSSGSRGRCKSRDWARALRGLLVLALLLLLTSPCFSPRARLTLKASSRKWRSHVDGREWSWSLVVHLADTRCRAGRRCCRQRVAGSKHVAATGSCSETVKRIICFRKKLFSLIFGLYGLCTCDHIPLLQVPKYTETRGGTFPNTGN